MGIPTVTDRVAQMVVKMYLEPLVEPHFHQDSYGYRPGRSAIQAVGVARQRCWRIDWVLDLDIKGFFDNLDHALLMRAVRKHTDCRWIILYIARWLKAPAQLPDGTLVAREQGTPQGGVISPLLANLFLHYAFDVWMQRHYPIIPFERYADDIIVHCKSERQALWLKTSWPGGWPSASWNSILRRPRLFTARMWIGQATIRRKASISWGSSFGPGEPRAAWAVTLSASSRQ